MVENYLKVFPAAVQLQGGRAAAGLTCPKAPGYLSDLLYRNNDTARRSAPHLRSSSTIHTSYTWEGVLFSSYTLMPIVGIHHQHSAHAWHKRGKDILLWKQKRKREREGEGREKKFL